MTAAAPAGSVNRMRRMIFGVAIAVGLATRLAAQEVPGRDLLLFPLGALAEPQALATSAGLGLWNPAAAVLRDTSRVRGTIAALASPADQAVSMQLVELSGRLPGGVTASLSAVRGAVDGLLRTEDSPFGVAELPYGTYVFSAGVARRQEHVAVGIAARHRTGRLDGERRGALGLDAGVIADELFGVDARVGASSFLWRPASSSSERTTYGFGADARVWGRDDNHQVRAGYAYAHTEALSREHYVFAAGHWSGLELRGGIAELRSFGAWSRRLRLGVGLHRARYLVALGREESGAGLDPVYQFTLSATLP